MVVDSLEEDLLDTVGKLIGKPVTITDQVDASSATQGPKPVTTATALPLSTPPTDAPSVVPVSTPRMRPRRSQWTRRTTTIRRSGTV
jgi:hypothetical protein